MSDVTFSNEMLDAAAERSLHNREPISTSTVVRCFYCKQFSEATEVVEFASHSVKPGSDKDTGVCPKCGIDSLLSDNMDLPIRNDAFIEALKARQF